MYVVLDLGHVQAKENKLRTYKICSCASFCITTLHGTHCSTNSHDSTRFVWWKISRRGQWQIRGLFSGGFSYSEAIDDGSVEW